MFPPQRPLRGEWESIHRSRAGVKSTLDFEGSTVQHSEVILKQGRYHVDRDRLYMIFDGEPETSMPFHFNCGELILDSPPRKLMSVWTTPQGVFAPIVGKWSSAGSVLDLEPDGSFQERREELRKGTFQMTAKSVRIHWTDSEGPGGGEWSAQIKHRHLMVSVGGMTTEYRYVPPRFVTDL
jgi:hypothetical protein